MTAEKLTEDECRAALRAYGMDPLEIQALFDLALTDPTVHACVTLWRLGERTLPKTLTQLVLHLGKEKAAYLRQATEAVEARVMPTAGTLCESCGAQVLRVRDQAGQWLALEPTPSPEGQWVLRGSQVYTIAAIEGRGDGAHATHRCGSAVAVYFCGPSNQKCKCECAKGGPCEHSWDGPGYETEHSSEASCSRCGLGAIQHSLWCGP